MKALGRAGPFVGMPLRVYKSMVIGIHYLLGIPAGHLKGKESHRCFETAREAGPYFFRKEDLGAADLSKTAGADACES